MIEALLTYYLLLGQHHAAYWHQEVLVGAPLVVTEHYLGIAACLDYPFNTVLRVEDLETGAIVYAVVTDRMADYHNCQRFDAWPLTMDRLGSNARLRGVLQVRVSVIPGVYGLRGY